MKPNRSSTNTGPSIDQGNRETDAAYVARLRREIRRCHRRLEIDRLYKLNGKGKLVPEKVPYERRLSIPDGISCRDETIRMQDRRLDRFKGDRA